MHSLQLQLPCLLLPRWSIKESGIICHHQSVLAQDGQRSLQPFQSQQPPQSQRNRALGEQMNHCGQSSRHSVIGNECCNAFGTSGQSNRLGTEWEKSCKLSQQQENFVKDFGVCILPCVVTSDMRSMTSMSCMTSITCWATLSVQRRSRALSYLSK